MLLEVLEAGDFHFQGINGWREQGKRVETILLGDVAAADPDLRAGKSHLCILQWQAGGVSDRAAQSRCHLLILSLKVGAGQERSENRQYEACLPTHFTQHFVASCASSAASLL